MSWRTVTTDMAKIRSRISELMKDDYGLDVESEREALENILRDINQAWNITVVQQLADRIMAGCFKTIDAKILERLADWFNSKQSIKIATCAPPGAGKSSFDNLIYTVLSESSILCSPFVAGSRLDTITVKAEHVRVLHSRVLLVDGMGLENERGNKENAELLISGQLKNGTDLRGQIPKKDKLKDYDAPVAVIFVVPMSAASLRGEQAKIFFEGMRDIRFKALRNGSMVYIAVTKVDGSSPQEIAENQADATKVLSNPDVEEALEVIAGQLGIPKQQAFPIINPNGIVVNDHHVALVFDMIETILDNAHNTLELRKRNAEAEEEPDDSFTYA